MVAPEYSEARRSMAKKIGLGRKPKDVTAAPAPAEAEQPAPKRGRRKATASEKAD